jgi:hypothetical protein
MKKSKGLLILTSLSLLGGTYTSVLTTLPVVHAEKVDGVCQVETKSGNVEFNIKGEVNKVRKPVDLLAIIDTSSSMVENFGKALDSLTALVESLDDNDNVTFAHYVANMPNSYNAGNGNDVSENGAITKRYTKQEALGYLAKLKGFPVEGRGVQYNDMVSFMGADLYTKEGNINFQDIYMQGHPEKSTISVIQFTDGWDSGENIDTDFAAWATVNAKTFMTVAYKNNGGANGGPTDFSVRRMKEKGHPNIYDERVTPIDNVAIVKQFADTGVETTQVNAKATIKVTPEEGLKLKTVKLVKADGTKEDLAIEGNKVNVEKELEDGKWVVEVTVEGVVHETRKVATTVTSNGTELGRGEIVFDGCQDDVKGKGATLSFVDMAGNELKGKETLVEAGKDLGVSFKGTVDKEIKVGDRLYRLVKISLGESNVEGNEIVGAVTEQEQNYVAYYEEVKVAPVKVKFVDDKGKELKETVNLTTTESKLGGEFNFAVDKKLVVNGKDYELVDVTLNGGIVKEIKGQFGETELVYVVNYKEVVKPTPPKKTLPKTSAVK